MREPREVIRRPLVTEKSTALKGDKNQYCFVVDRGANKVEIRQAVEAVFNVHVTQVRTLRVRGKRKRVGRHVGLRPDWKKAVVTLREGDRIEFFEGA